MATLQTPGQWSRPPDELIRGVRPNSPAATTSVDSSRPRLIEIVDQGREGAVEIGKQDTSVVVESAEGRAAVTVPGDLIEHGLEHVDSHDADAGFDQTTSKQTILAEGCAPVLIAERLRLGGQVEADCRLGGRGRFTGAGSRRARTELASKSGPSGPVPGANGSQCVPSHPDVCPWGMSIPVLRIGPGNRTDAGRPFLGAGEMCDH